MSREGRDFPARDLSLSVGPVSRRSAAEFGGAAPDDAWTQMAAAAAISRTSSALRKLAIDAVTLADMRVLCRVDFNVPLKGVRAAQGFLSTARSERWNPSI